MECGQPQRQDQLLPEKAPLVTHWREGCVGPFGEEKFLAFAGNRTTIARTSSPKLSHYTDWFNPVAQEYIQNNSRNKRSGLIWLMVWYKGVILEQIKQCIWVYFEDNIPRRDVV